MCVSLRVDFTCGACRRSGEINLIAPLGSAAIGILEKHPESLEDSGSLGVDFLAGLFSNREAVGKKV